MSRARVAVLSVITKQMSVAAAAAEYGYSRRQLHRLLARYRDDGLDAVEPRSRRPNTNPTATAGAVRQRIVELRLELAKDGVRPPIFRSTWIVVILDGVAMSGADRWL